MTTAAPATSETVATPDRRPAPGKPAAGLSADEAGRRLKATGPNTMPETAVRPIRAALGKLWAPVPWMLEAAVVLEVALGRYPEAVVIAGLLVFNAALSLVQEGRAQVVSQSEFPLAPQLQQ